MVYDTSDLCENPQSRLEGCRFAIDMQSSKNADMAYLQNMNKVKCLCYQSFSGSFPHSINLSLNLICHTSKNLHNHKIIYHQESAG